MSKPPRHCEEGIARRGNLPVLCTVAGILPGDCHGLRPRNDSGSGKVVRIRRGAGVDSVHTAERHGGRSLQAASAPLRVGAAASRPPYSDSIVTSLRLGKLRLTDILARIPNVFYR